MRTSSTTSSRLPLPMFLAFAAVYLIWGSTYLGIRIAIETLPPFLMAGLRFLFAGSLLYVFMRLSGAPRPPAQAWRAALLIGSLMMFGGNGIVTWAQQSVPSAFAALLVGTMPLWMVVLDATLYRGPKPGPWVCAGLALGLVGVGLLVGPGEGSVPWPGALLLAFAALSWSVGSLQSRTARLPKSPWLSAAMQMITGGAVLLVAATITGEWSQVNPAAISGRSIAAMLYLALFGSIVAHSAYIYLLQRTSASAVATYAFVNPVIALGLGWLTGETIGGRALAGAVLIVGAVVLIHVARLRARHPKPTPRPALEPVACAQGDAS